MLTLIEIEKDTIYSRLIMCECNVIRTAKSLGIGVRTLQRKMTSYGLPRAIVGMPYSVRREMIRQFIAKELESGR